MCRELDSLVADAQRAIVRTRALPDTRSRLGSWCQGVSKWPLCLQRLENERVLGRREHQTMNLETKPDATLHKGLAVASRAACAIVRHRHVQHL